VEGEAARSLNTTIMLFLVQDGITNGAIYALLGLALGSWVVAVTRVILISAGRVRHLWRVDLCPGPSGQMPGSARLAVAMGVVAFGLDLFAGRKSLRLRPVAARSQSISSCLLPSSRWTSGSPGHHPSIAVSIALSLSIVAMIGLFSIASRPADCPHVGCWCC